MAYCPGCGNEVSDEQDVCLSCGKALNKNSANSNAFSNIADTGSLGWSVLGFLIPIVGLVLYLIWKTERPKNAKEAGIGALTSVSIMVIIYIIILAAYISTP